MYFTFQNEKKKLEEKKCVRGGKTCCFTQLCQRSFEEITRANPDLPKTWTKAPVKDKVRAIQFFLDQLEVAVRQERLAAARALLYIGQGE